MWHSGILFSVEYFLVGLLWLIALFFIPSCSMLGFLVWPCERMVGSQRPTPHSLRLLWGPEDGEGSDVFPFDHKILQVIMYGPHQGLTDWNKEQKIAAFHWLQLSMHQNVHGISWIYIWHSLTWNFLVPQGMVHLFLVGRVSQNVNGLFFPLAYLF